MSNPSAQVDGYIRKNKQWSAPLQRLREVVLGTPLTEDVKWRVPCYTLGGKNVVFLGAFKDACTLSFVKGVLLKDPRAILQRIGENTQSAKLVKFTTVDEIDRLAPVLRDYILEAIAVEQSGQKVAMKSTADFPVADEFQQQLDGNKKLKAAFEALTPGRQRAYLLYFSGAKQSKTRAARVEKVTPQILAGKGLDDD